MEILSRSTKETEELAGKIASKLKQGDVLALYGDLGSGKTTFTKYLVEALGIHARVQSPTFVIVRGYKNGGENIKSVNHVDLYRVRSSEEVGELGLFEMYEEDGAITVIEWPEVAEDFLPESVIKIHFETIGENERRIYVQDKN